MQGLTALACSDFGASAAANAGVVGAMPILHAEPQC